MCPIDHHLPRRIRDDLLAAAVGPFDHEMEDQPRLAGRPGPVAKPVVQHFHAQDVLARGQQGRQVDRIGVEAARIAGGGAPLDPPAIDRQQVAAVGRDKARRPAGRAAERQLAAKQAGTCWATSAATAARSSVPARGRFAKAARAARRRPDEAPDRLPRPTARGPRRQRLARRTTPGSNLQST